MARVLLVEDDETIQRMVFFALRQGGGIEVDLASSGAAALTLYRQTRPDLVILDLLLPDMDGFEVCRSIRRLGPTPILMLTALAQENHVLHGFELGADDYLTKPFSVRVLLARVDALLRRSGQRPAETGETIAVGDLVIDLRRIEVRRNGEPIDLTPTEFRIFSVLARNAGRVVSAVDLLREIQDAPYNEREAQEIVKVHIRHLRHKIEPDKDRPRYIRTVRGFGYMLDDPTRDRSPNLNQDLPNP